MNPNQLLTVFNRCFSLLIRLVGLAALICGLTLDFFVFFAIWRGLFTAAFKDGRALQLGGLIVAMIGIFMTMVGFRLTFSRPNKYQSILSPFAWYFLAFVFLGLACIIAPLGKYDGEACRRASSPLLFALMCFWSGWNAARHVEAEPTPRRG
jgi:uncharacterized membrane protein